MTELNENELPKVLVYRDESFGTDDLTNVGIENYTLGYYEVPAKLNPMYPEGTHELNSSEFFMDSDEFHAYRDFHGAKELMEDYDKDITKFKPMMYRHQ